jgi:arsenate reductase (glutaredoxin)
MLFIYGLKNCDSCKKALAWCTAEGIEFSFHDFKKQGLPEDLLDRWLDHINLEILTNRRGTTWRGLSDEQKALAETPATARDLLLENTSLMKRPIIEHGESFYVGFNADTQKALKG